MQYLIAKSSSDDGNSTIWQVDQCMLDMRVKYESPSGETMRCRPWLTLIMDDSARAICVAWVSPEPPSNEAIRDALIMASQDTNETDKADDTHAA